MALEAFRQDDFDLALKRTIRSLTRGKTVSTSPQAILLGGHVENDEAFAESVIREIYEETGLTIQNPQLVGIKNWPLDTGGRYIVICYKATEFSGTLQSSEEGEVSWVQKDQIPNLNLAYDMLPLMEMMEAPDKSEFFYPRRTEDGWEKKIF
ncbi:8-oxo-dGTP diphosphatase [Streptococcus pneumoniae]|nr:8-oxo-dGTP diphosphatase [Streptococcus pneumoniae]